MSTCLFIGSKKFGLRCLQTIHAQDAESLCAAVTIDDRHDTRTELSGFSAYAENAFPLHVLQTPRELCSFVEKYSPTLVFVCGWYSIIPEHVLAVPPLGFVGFHFSLLPRYRGGAPVVWSMINGETTTGFSLFQFTKEMDAGPLFAQGKIPFGKRDYIGDVLPRIENAAIESLKEVFPRIMTGAASSVPQSGTPSYAAQRRPEDGRIHWSRPREHVYNFIRAQSHPYPGAFTVFEEKRLTVWKCEKVPHECCAPPGQVIAFDAGKAVVACGDNAALRLESVSLEGDHVSSKEILKNAHIRFE